MLNEGITFEPSCPHLQEQNGVSEHVGRTIMDMTRSTIIGDNIPDKLWPEIALAMVHVKNLKPTSTLAGKTPYKLFKKETPSLDHLRILGSTIYVLIHEEDQKGTNSKGAKFAPRAQQGVLVGYDGTTIYRVYLEKSSKVIRVKDLPIHEDANAKKSTDLPTYDAICADKQGEWNDTLSNSKLSKTLASSEPKRTRGRPRKHPLPDSHSNHSDSDSNLSHLSKKNSKQKRAKKQQLLRNSAINSDSDSDPLSDLPIEEPTENNTPQRPSRQRIKTLITQLHTALVTQDWGDAFKATNDDGNDKPDPFILFTRKLEEVRAYDPQTFAFVSQFDIMEPTSYEAAIKSAQAEKWTEAIMSEWDSLIVNSTREEVKLSDLPSGTSVLSGKWVFKLKRGPNNEITRYKARWVVKGYEQQYGVNYDQTYAAVVKPMAFRALFAIAAYLDLDIDQMDVQTAFLYSFIDQLIYVEVPPGYKKERPGIVCKLLKGLYGLKQAPRLWYERLSTFLIEKLGLKRLYADHGIFSTKAGVKGPIISLWVDDLNLFAPAKLKWMARMKGELTAAFKMVDMEPIQFYLGLKVERNREKQTIKLSQPAYIEKMLHKFFLQNATTAKTPMKGSLLPALAEHQATLKEIRDYQEMVGSLMFSMLETRPDIAFAVSTASRFLQNPAKAHAEAVKFVLRYLSGSRTRGITFGGGDLTIIGYSDSDWAGDVAGRKVNLRLCIHAKWRTNQLVFKETSNSGTIIHRSRVYCTNPGR